MSTTGSEAREAAGHPVLQTLLITTVAGVGAGLALGLVDGLVAAASASPFCPGALWLACCLCAPLGLVAGAALGLLAGGLRRSWPATLSWARLRADPQEDRRWAARLLALAEVLVLQVLLVFAFGTGLAGGMANPTLGALSTALVAGVGLLLCGAAWFPLYWATLPLTRLLPRVGTSLATAALLLALGLALAAALVLGSMDWRVLRFGPWITLALWLPALGLAARALHRPRAAAAVGRAPVLLVALALGIGPALLAPAAGRSEAAVAAAQGGLLLPRLVSLGRALGDRDGDGYSGWFAGGDCDDADPAINPAARDLPGNGVDENCIGGDARLPGRKQARRPAPASQPAAASRPAFKGNVLLICIDTLRADKLGAMGHPDGLTPNIDRLAGAGTLFQAAVTQGANTPQSFPSIFTSRYTTALPFYKRNTGYPRLKPEAHTLFEALTDAGVRTAAVTSHFYFRKRRGITQGVEDWDNRDATNIKGSNKDIASPRVVPRAISKLKQLAGAGGRFVLFVHLFEPHSTYVTHRQFRITKRGVAGLQQKYDFEIKFADLWLGKLLAALKHNGLAEDTAVMLFSDHGESFGEHRFYFHGQALYNEVLHVPLIVRVPGLKPHKVPGRVAMMDLAPTLLELMGVPRPDSFQGRSLLPQLHGEPLPAGRSIGAALMPYPAWPKGQQALYSGHYKALRRVTENRFEVYDLQADPREQKDLARSRPELAARLRQELARLVEQEMGQ